jgi:hypothetical protein
MVVGTNWFLGYAHQTEARSKMLRAYQTRKSIAKVLEVFLRAGVDIAIGHAKLFTQALRDAENRVGRKMHIITTPHWELKPDGVNRPAMLKALDECVELGATFCYPHMFVTDRLYDGLARKIRFMDGICKEIRKRKMIPGLSTHLPECIVAADATGLDVESYICIYNAAGFLMPVEIDWTQRVIRSAKKPVTTIKPMAAGRLMPYVALPFVWTTLREQDLVAVGTITPDEAKELIEISLAVLEQRGENRQLQFTRSKQALTWPNRP